MIIVLWIALSSQDDFDVCVRACVCRLRVCVCVCVCVCVLLYMYDRFIVKHNFRDEFPLRLQAVVRETHDNIIIKWLLLAQPTLSLFT